MDNFDLRKYLTENKTPGTYIDDEGRPLGEDMYSSNEPHFSPRELKAAFLYAFESAQKNPDMNVEMAFRAWQDIPKLD